jgi:hypothetical protein
MYTQRWFGVFMGAILALAPMYGQNDSARLQGTVLDSTGAAVSGAKITVLSGATSRSVSVNSAADGTFSFPGLAVGDYTLKGELAAFKTVSQIVHLDPGQVANVELVLSPGDISETVDVTAPAAIVDSANSALSTTIQSRQVTDLPLNGRNFTQLATLVPGVTRGLPNGQQTGNGNQAETFRNSSSGGSSLVVNGLRPQANNFLLDGVDNNESLVNTIVFFPPAEAIQEFSVQTNIAPAEFGRAGGATVNTVIKSGSNQIHGSAFWFLRNSDLDARPTFDVTKPEFRRHQFGGTLGFPIVKNKLFVFGDYQGLRQFQPLGLDHASVPTAKMRTGDFSELLNPAVSLLPSPIVIRNVATGVPYPGNIIPASGILTPGKNYLNAYPLPNLPGVQQNFEISRNQTQNFDDFDVRVDYIVSSNDQLFGRLSYGDDSEVSTTRLPPNLPAGFGAGTQFNSPRGFVLGETHAFSSNMINEFRASWQRSFLGYNPPFENTPVSQNLGIPNANVTPLLGGGALIGGFNSELEYTGDFGPYLVPENTYQLTDAITRITGSHSIKAGINLIYRQVNLFRPQAGKGFFSLCGNGNGNGDGCAAGSTGYEVSDVLAGFVDTYQLGSQTGYFGTRSWEDGAYVQDDWRVNRRLTLNLGVRYDFLSYPSERYGRQSNFDLANGSLITPMTSQLNGGSLVHNNYLDFAPRVGFAYQMDQKGNTVVRGGFGTFYFIDRGGIDNQLAQNPPFSGTQSYSYAQGYRITLAGEAPNNTSNPLVATGTLPSRGVPPNFSYTNPQNVNVVADLFNNKNSFVNEWNIQFQRQVFGNSVVRIGYVGTEGHRLTTYYDDNQQIFNAVGGAKAFPKLGTVQVQANIGNSNYNSLQMEFERRLTNGLQFRAAYTLSKSIDDSPGAFDGTRPQDIHNLKLERSLSDFYQKHVLVLSSLYELPFGKGKKFGANWSRPLDVALGGWQLNGIFTASSGLPINLTVNGQTLRPDVFGNVSTTGSTQGYFSNPKAFVAPPNNTFGTPIRPGYLGRNAFTGPRYIDADISVFKDFPLYERFKLQFRAEFYNLANHPRFNNPDGNLSDSTFAVINSTVPSSERQIEMALRLTF